ncbi:MAG TPA: SDR family oxidoreductase [Gemmatimonadota bacterium]|nr:SDR family oxidoreductase [Gemmatimonadota bacterium]
METTGKVALVTGSGVRVGKRIALALAGTGMHVAVHYHASAGPADETVAEIRAMGVEAEPFQADLSQLLEVRGLFDGIDARWGRLDVLINSAAIFPRTPWDEIDEATWDYTLDVNLKAPFFTAWHAVPLMRRGGGGKIVNIADWAGLRPYKNYLPYVISKGGIITMTKALALELAPEIAVNAIAPGPVMLPEDFGAAATERIRKATLLEHLGSPDDVAKSVVYLVAMTDFVTGHVLVVDGGRLIA